MRTVYFKNGTEKEITQEIAEKLKTQILKGCGDFQMFSDQNDEVFLFINLSEVVYIA